MCKRQSSDERLEFVIERNGDRVRVKCFYRVNGVLHSVAAPWGQRVEAEVLTPHYLASFIDERQNLIARLKLAANQLPLF